MYKSELEIGNWQLNCEKLSIVGRDCYPDPLRFRHKTLNQSNFAQIWAKFKRFIVFYEDATNVYSSHLVSEGESGRCSFAFTLAEVLITLAIIGVVAALTIPVLIQNSQRQQYYSSFYKEYSNLSQIISSLVGENNDMAGAIANYGSITNAIASKIKTSQICPANTMDGSCMPSTYVRLDGVSGASNFYVLDRILFLDGQAIAIQIMSANCTGTYNSMTNLCDIINIDTNGLAGPNMRGRDIFRFYLTNTKLIPDGAQGSWAWTPSWTWYCDPNATDPNAGMGCASRLLQEGAMKY